MGKSAFSFQMICETQSSKPKTITKFIFNPIRAPIESKQNQSVEMKQTEIAPHFRYRAQTVHRSKILYKTRHDYLLASEKQYRSGATSSANSRKNTRQM